MSVSRLHNLVAEAFNHLFAKHGKPEIAPAQAQHAEQTRLIAKGRGGGSGSELTVAKDRYLILCAGDMGMQVDLNTAGQNLLENAECPKTYTSTYTLSQCLKITTCISHKIREHA
jgi:hypothetical protein